ncbi:MAG TPA: PDZ domain-containing protein [Candidatus Polarisedimenticolaceae bacterium]|nr:PDZ domain-containing protein [Candidatus Polarisedimenticolaceae bacterium]
MRLGAFLCAVALAVAGAAVAQTEPLDAIRAKVVALDLEGAVAAADALLATPGIDDDTRVGAIDLKAQAHVAAGELDAAERDFRAILALRADYAPKPELVGKRGMERFARVASSTIGTIAVSLDPQDGVLTVDGRPVTRDAAGIVKAAAGDRVVHVEKKGFDPADATVHVVAGQEAKTKIDLVPNARAIVVLTDIPEVAVTVDGVGAGKTARASADGAAELLVDGVGVGTHEIRLEKPCFAAESIEAMVRIDLADRSPERMKVVTMRPARARVAVAGARYPGDLRVDGETVATLPAETFTMCPGERRLEIVAGGRVVWSGVVDAGEADMTVDLSPRPSCALVGAEWPRAWAQAASSWSLIGRVDRPATDLATADGWKGLTLPPGTDLAVAVVPRGGVAGEDRIFLYSPALAVVEDPGGPPSPVHPRWTVASIGADLVDGPDGVLVARVLPGGPAERIGARAGDRVASIAGHAVSRASEARVALRGPSVAMVLAGPEGSRTVDVPVVDTPQPPDGGRDDGRVIRAAWAAADGAAGGPGAGIALSQLAAMLSDAGHERAAAEAWRKVRVLPDVPAALVARADYALGAVAPKGEAEALLEKARREAEAAGDLRLAAAAADRLADLGKSIVDGR